MGQRRTKVAFKYLGPYFAESYFFLVFPFLSDSTQVTSEEDADLIVFSVYHDIAGVELTEADRSAGRFRTMPRLVRQPGKIYLFYSGENVLPNMELCDYAITHSYCDHPNHLRLPYWVVALRCYGLTGADLVRSQDNIIPPIHSRRDCNFLFSNQVSFRENFATELMKFCEVDCPGVSLRNTSETVAPGVRPKIEFLKKYNFTMAFENSKDDGYTTEKLIEPLLAGSIPLYWGNNRVGDDLNPACYIQVEEFPSVADLAGHMKYLLSDASAYEQIFRAPRFPANGLPAIVTLEYSQRFFDTILDRIALRLTSSKPAETAST